MAEFWKPVVGYEGMYEVSNYGRVKSIRREKPVIMSTHLNNGGYEMVKFKFGKKMHNHTVHRLVARAFCDGYDDGLVVNHKDANRTNNVAGNLEWVTQKENIADCIERGSFDVKSAHKVAHEKRKRPVEQYTKDGEFVARYESAREAAKAVGIHENCVSRVCRGHRNFTAGYRFIYV